MTDYPPSDDAAHPPRKTPTPSHGHPKRNQRHRKNHSHNLPQVDGAVSDSVTYAQSSPQPRRDPKQRQQSVAVGNAASQTLQHPLPNKPHTDPRQRPASLGGNMLPATPLKEQAYAGPTFQMSPAPSSLPVPKFFSRSVPNVAAKTSLAQRMEADQTPENESSPEPDVASPSMPDRNNQKSPLDVFFKADRHEREQWRSGSGSGLSPEMARKQSVSSGPFSAPQPQAMDGLAQGLDGSGRASNSPYGIPYTNGQIQHQRPLSSPHVAANLTSSANASDTESDREAKTQALKALLFNNFEKGATPPQQSSTPPRTGFPTQTYETPSPFQRPTSGPSASTPPSDNSARQHPNNSYYHYGNQKNLSPLFKAASGRNDTPPPRPSGLRQHEDAPPDFLQSTVSRPQHPAANIDPNSFSRNYLDQHIRSSAPPPPPSSLPYMNGNTRPTYGTPPFPGPGPNQAIFTSPGPAYNGQNGTANANSTPPSAPAPAPPQSASSSFAGAGAGATPPSTTNFNDRDVKTMEDDLRRMLNLNALGK